MIKRKNWTKKMLAVAACAGLLMTNPAFTEAATAAERSAYQAVFDADYYRSAYPDVAAAFGNNKAALFNHFVNYGLREGRSCSADCRKSRQPQRRSAYPHDRPSPSSRR